MSSRPWPAPDVVRTIVNALGYPTTKLAVTPDMVLIGATDTQAAFVLANRLEEAWESRLSVVNGPGGAHGRYEVVRWILTDGVVAGWKQMEIVERRIGEIAARIGGTVKVTPSH